MDRWVSTAFPGFTILDQYISNSIIVLRITSDIRGNPCPECGVWTERVHSKNYRTVQDLPIYGAPVILRVRTRKFFCSNRLCLRKVFVERFGDFLFPSQQVTTRLNEMLTRIGFALGGNPGAAFSSHIGISVGKDTLLRRIRATPSVRETNIDLEVIGIDDWAYRRGQRYGTIICDLKQRRVLDVLPDRSVSTVANWLKAHPEVKMVTRDRAGSYADAIRQGLPHATQIADRWHLLKNLGDAVEHYLARHHLPKWEDHSREEKQKPLEEERKLSQKEKVKSERRLAKWKKLQHVQQLHKSGVGIRTIAKETGFSRQTVRAYLTWTEVPETQRTPQKTLLDSYRQQIADLVNQSCSGQEILRRIQEQGYQGSRSTLSQYVADLRRSSSSGQKAFIRHRRVSPRKAARILTRMDEKIDEEDKPYLKSMLEEIESAPTVRNLCKSFQILMENEESERLNDWLTDAISSGVRELQRFARGVKRDFHAVAAGIAQPWSNGQVEGQVNRLKMIKRQMYGRAGFTLLRARVLYRGIV